MSATPWLGVLAFVLGLAFGSFANVVIWRVPRRESLSVPPSHCPSCDHPIRWRDNIPVLSWLMLRGRCRDCGASISLRYPAVELASAALWVTAWVAYGSTPKAVFAAAFFYLLLVLATIDLDTYRLPNRLVALLGALGLFGVTLSLFGVDSLPLTPGGGLLASPIAATVAGGLGSAGLTLGIALAYERARGREGFGMGDVKLLAAMGPFLGAYTFMVLFVGSMAGAIIGVIAARRSSEGLAARIPFGPFLAGAAVVVAVVGPHIWAWYLGLLV